VVVGWGPDFAVVLGRLVDSGEAVVSLVIVQRIRDPDDPQQKGIFLGADLLAWMSTARASLDIDQYVYHECGDDSSNAAP
jgi:hypothetical protein